LHQYTQPLLERDAPAIMDISAPAISLAEKASLGHFVTSSHAPSGVRRAFIRF
jgi:hypothetical protein